MKLKFNHAGKLQITKPTINVTAPGYNAEEKDGKLVGHRLEF